MTLGHMAGIIAVEELRNVRNKKPRNRWKDRTAMTVDCFRNRRKIMTVVISQKEVEIRDGKT